MSAGSLARIIRNLSSQLLIALRDGTATIEDARQIIDLIREARGYLLGAENELDPTQPAPTQEG